MHKKFMEKIFKSRAFIPQKYPIIEFNKITSYISKLLCKKYYINPISYQKNIIKNIIYDDRTRIVALFKEQLIINDTSEYMKRYYNKRESFIRLNKYFQFYEEFSKLFPNYIVLNEAKYIYKNIHKKQKIIYLQQNNSNSKIKKNHKTKNKLKNNKIFSSEVYESIEKNSDNLNSTIFGIHNSEKNNDKKDSILQIKEIINKIENYELSFENKEIQINSFNNKQNIYKGKNINNIKNNKNNIIINNYYYNNNSILTKNIPLESLLIYPQNNNTNNNSSINNIKNDKKFSIIRNNILMNLKKNKIKKHNMNSYTLKNSITFKSNKVGKDMMENNKNNNAILDNFNMTNSTTYNNNSKIISKKNRTTINQSSNNNNYISLINPNIDQKYNNDKSNQQFNLKNNSHQYSNNISPNTARVYNYQNLKLISILRKLNNIDINGSKQKRRKKKKLNFSLINKIINDNNKTNCLSDRIEMNQESFNKRERTHVKNHVNRTSREKKEYNLKKYFKTIKNIQMTDKAKIPKKIIKNSIFQGSILINNNKANENKKNNNTQKIKKINFNKGRSNTIIFNIKQTIKIPSNYINTDRSNYQTTKLESFLKNRRKLFNKDNLKKQIINDSKEINNKKLINKNNINSKSFLINENLNNNTNNKINDIISIQKLRSSETQLTTPLNSHFINNKHKKKIIEKSLKNRIKNISLNINSIIPGLKKYNVSNTSKNNSKIKVKGIKIKNLNKILNIKNEQKALNSQRNSERTKNGKNLLIMPINKNKENLIKKSKIIKKHDIKSSYTERERAKRLFFSNNI